MKIYQIVNIGLYIPSYFLNRTQTLQELMNHISDDVSIYGRISLTLKDYLVKYSKVFDAAFIKVTAETGAVLPNETLKGLKGMINSGQIVIGVQLTIIHESNLKITDFSYPFRMLSAAFIIRKPEYKPEVLGILKTFSFPMGFTHPMTI